MDKTVTIIRHGKVNYTWKKRCSSAEFDEQCRLYDMAPIENMPKAADHRSDKAYFSITHDRGTRPDKVYISALDRSFQTAKMLFGNMTFSATDSINEVPLKSSFDTGLRLPLWFWNVSGRLQWLCNSGRQPETRHQTKDRAELFVQKIEKAGGDYAIVTHGFFMHTLIAVMKQHGFKPDKVRLNYQNGEAIILKKGIENE